MRWQAQPAYGVVPADPVPALVVPADLAPVLVVPADLAPVLVVPADLAPAPAASGLRTESERTVVTVEHEPGPTRPTDSWGVPAMLPIADIDLGDVLLALLAFYFLALALYLVIVLFADIFGRRDLSGWGKAGWTLLIFILPLIGIVAYLVARPAEPARGRSTAGGYQAAHHAARRVSLALTAEGQRSVAGSGVSLCANSSDAAHARAPSASVVPPGATTQQRHGYAAFARKRSRSAA